MKYAKNINRKANNSVYKSEEGLTIVVQNNSSWLNTALMLTTACVSVSLTLLSYRQNKQNQAQPVQRQTKLETGEQQKLHAILDDRFDEQELRNLCFDIGVDYEDLPFSGQENKARELIGLCMRTGQLLELKAAIRAQRPNLLPIVNKKKAPANLNPAVIGMLPTHKLINSISH